MSDAAIGDLPNVTLDDDIMMPVESQGEAGHVTGHQFKSFLRGTVQEEYDSVKSSLEAMQTEAEEVLEEAKDVAQQAVNKSRQWWFTDADPSAYLGDSVPYSEINSWPTSPITRPSATTMRVGDVLVWNKDNTISYVFQLNDDSVAITGTMGRLMGLGDIKSMYISTGDDLNTGNYGYFSGGMRIFVSRGASVVNGPPDLTENYFTLLVRRFGAFGVAQQLSAGLREWRRYSSGSKWTDWEEITPGGPILTAPNGTKFKITVANDGALSAVQI